MRMSIPVWSLAGFAVRSRCSLRGGLTSYLGSGVITQRLPPRFAPRLPRSDTPDRHAHRVARANQSGPSQFA